MIWNWQDKDWPHFFWDAGKLARAEALFIEGAGLMAGVSLHLNDLDQKTLMVDVMSREALETSAIEGEIFNRESVQSSIRRRLGFSTDRNKATPGEMGVAEMMVDLYLHITDPLDHETLFKWHTMVMNGRRDLDAIGHYRTHTDPMQIVSGPDYARKVHYEAPPSDQIFQEMTRFLEWFDQTKIGGTNPLPSITRAGIAHLWFESLHPFEDGNGRIGRMIAEKALAQGLSTPTLTGLSATLHRRRKEYYQALESASKTLNISDWLLWFATVVIESQKRSQAQVEFLLNKTRLMDNVRNSLNARQEKAILRIFQEGAEGFKGGLSAKNYATITGTSTATTTRDLRDLVEKGILYRTGELKAARYHLTVPLKPVAPVTLKDIS
jgi:Fic family protein